MRAEHIEVIPYQATWPLAFKQIVAHLMPSIAGSFTRIEHVGSTAVPGLVAKPIIDIDIVIAQVSQLQTLITSLAKLGYYCEGELGVSQRYAFSYEPTTSALKLHHLYVCLADSLALRHHLALRDYLRTHRAAREQYAQIKLQGAQLFANDIEQYNRYKADFIADIYRLAAAEK